MLLADSSSEWRKHILNLTWYQCLKIKIKKEENDVNKHKTPKKGDYSRLILGVKEKTGAELQTLFQQINFQVSVFLP